MNSKTKIAVIGVGAMGMNHIRVLNELPEFALCAVCDTDPEKLEPIHKYNSAAELYSDPVKMVKNIDLDAVIIATPIENHYKTTMLCQEAELHILLEKPMASTKDECLSIVGSWRTSNTQLLIGHIERYNPVVIKIGEFLKNNYLGTINYIETTRVGFRQMQDYGKTYGITTDLSVHDIDLVALFFGPYHSFYAHTICSDPNKKDIHTHVLFELKNGLKGHSEFSWIAHKKERTIKIFGEHGIFFADLITQDLWFYRYPQTYCTSSQDFFEASTWKRDLSEEAIRFPIRKCEPLKAELNFFHSLISNPKERHNPLYGVKAVENCHVIQESAKHNKIVFINE